MSIMSDCDGETETTSHFFLRCQFFANEREKLRNVFQIDDSIKNLNEESLIDVLLCPSDKLNGSKNKYFSTQSAIIKQPKVLKDLLLTSANFVQLLPICFSICLLKIYLQCHLLSS